MKFIRPAIVAILLVIHVVATYAHNNIGDSFETETVPSSNIDLNKIFFIGEFENTLFIDFEAVSNTIVSISIFQEEKVMMEDTVGDLPINTIYELNLSVMRPGDYILEIVTEEGFKIQKDIRVE